jgi:hypothetical protein
MEEKTTDPDYRQYFKRPGPKWLRTVWEFGDEMRGHNSFIKVALLMSLAINIFLGAERYYKRKEPPRVAVRFGNYIAWPEIEVMRLGEELVGQFLREAATPVFTITPGAADISRVAEFYDGKIFAALQKDRVQKASKQSFGASYRETWTLENIRRYNDPKFPSYLTVVGQATNTVISSENGVGKVDNYDLLCMWYIQRTANTPQNPLGLIIKGLRQVTDPQERDDIWNKTVPIDGSTFEGLTLGPMK